MWCVVDRRMRACCCFCAAPLSQIRAHIRGLRGHTLTNTVGHTLSTSERTVLHSSHTSLSRIAMTQQTSPFVEPEATGCLFFGICEHNEEGTLVATKTHNF